jgi:DNA-binding NarL/FixJ family response regulator
MTSDRIDSLSEREIEILRLLDARLSNAEIAEVLDLPPETVRRREDRIYRKLLLRTLSSAIDPGKALLSPPDEPPAP